MKKIKAEDYKLEIKKAPEDEGGYFAYIPQLDCWGDGDSIEAAVKDVLDAANDIIDMALEDGLRIPEPEKFKEEEYSGKLSLRIPKYLHREIDKKASEEGCSINQLIQSYIALGIGMKYGEQKITINIKDNTEKVQQSVIKNNNLHWSKQFYSKPGRKCSDLLGGLN